MLKNKIKKIKVKIIKVRNKNMKLIRKPINWYQILMTSMILVMAGMLFAMGIIAIQNHLKLNVGFVLQPGIKCEIYVSNTDGSNQTLILRNFDGGEDMPIEVNEGVLQGSKLTLSQNFIETYGDEFALVIYNYSRETLEVSLDVSLGMVEDYGASQGGPEWCILPMTDSSLYAGLGVYLITIDTAAVILPNTEITLDILLTMYEPPANTLISGPHFNATLKQINNGEYNYIQAYDQSITSITFDTWSSSYEAIVGSWDDEGAIDVSYAQDNGIKLFALDTDSDNVKETVYVLSPNTINFSRDSSFLLSYITALPEIKFDNINTSNVTDMSGMFQSCENLTTLDLSNFDTSNVTNMSSMFGGCALTTIDLSNLDTSSVKSMSRMFDNCYGLTTIGLSNLDTSSVTDMNSMFNACISLTTIDLSNLDTSSVKSMSGMFYDCYELTTIGLSNLDTSSVTDIDWMFYGCSNLTTIDLSSFDTSNVTNMYGMFAHCSNLTTIDLSSFDTSSVTDIRYMFEYCSNLTTLDVSGWDTSSVTDMYGMFKYCSNLTTLDLSNFDTSSVTAMDAMFYNCSNLTTIDLSSFDTSSVTDMYGMFMYCASLTTIYVSDLWNTANVTSSSSMFYNCSKLPNYNSSYMDKTYAHYNDGGYLTYKAHS